MDTATKFSYTNTQLSCFSGTYVKGYGSQMLESKTHIHYSGFYADYGNCYGSIMYIHTHSSIFYGNYVNVCALTVLVAGFHQSSK